MELRDLTQADLAYCKDNDASRSKFSDPNERIDFAWTLEHEGQIYAIGGMQKITDCCAWIWLSMTKDGKSKIRTIYRVIKEYTESVCRTHGIVRCQAWSEIGFEESKRLLEHLGLKKEGEPMPYFIDGKPAQLYVRYFGDS